MPVSCGAGFTDWLGFGVGPASVLYQDVRGPIFAAKLERLLPDEATR